MQDRLLNLWATLVGGVLLGVSGYTAIQGWPDSHHYASAWVVGFFTPIVLACWVLIVGDFDKKEEG